MADSSILTTIKKLLGIDESYEQFDQDIITHINTTFMYLNQIGIGPEDGFFIEDKFTYWDDFLMGRSDILGVKTYIFLRVRLAFDPPQPGYLVEALRKQIEELEWRMNTHIETTPIKNKWRGDNE